VGLVLLVKLLVLLGLLSVAALSHVRSTETC
jgi:hypothetical protein